MNTNPGPLDLSKIERGDLISIPAAVIEFREGGNTIWVQSPNGATILGIQVPPGSKVSVNKKECQNLVIRTFERQATSTSV